MLNNGGMEKSFRTYPYNKLYETAKNEVGK